jgi:hypothetical protein
MTRTDLTAAEQAQIRFDIMELMLSSKYSMSEHNWKKEVKLVTDYILDDKLEINPDQTAKPELKVI